MTRKECLDKAAECVLRDRNNEYGEPEQSFHYIADLWSAYLRTKIEPYDAAAMMALFKLARLRFNPYYEDGWTDLAGYAACGAELAGAEKAREDATRKWGEEYKRLKAKAEGDAKAEDCEELEFKRGDKVEVQMAPDSSTWASATIMAVYRDKDTCEWRYCVDFEDGWAHVTVPSAQVRPVSAPKSGDEVVVLWKHKPEAEGCEALVEKDAPQTPQELYQHIVDCNPATFHAPSYAEEQLEHHSRLQAHKPTGEELAEMAEEEPHG